MLATLLERTSRTFALAIPCLDEPLRTDVTVAYLLFRIADTIEDAKYLAQQEKLAALERLLGFLGELDRPSEHVWDFTFTRPPSDNPDYLALLSESHEVLAAVQERGGEIRAVIAAAAAESMAGMQRFVASSPSGMVRVDTIEQLREYCYCVAGLVGEMLTAIYVERVPKLAPIRNELWPLARWFGEGLQLVNVLKDADDDRRDGRVFVSNEQQRQELLALARADLQIAERYVALLETAQAPAGLIAFNRLPLRLAYRTLDVVESHGPGSKISRKEAIEIFTDVTAGCF